MQDLLPVNYSELCSTLYGPSWQTLNSKRTFYDYRCSYKEQGQRRFNAQTNPFSQFYLKSQKSCNRMVGLSILIGWSNYGSYDQFYDHSKSISRFTILTINSQKLSQRNFVQKWEFYLSSCNMDFLFYPRQSCSHGQSHDSLILCWI